MKFISEETIVNSWLRLIEFAKSRKALLNKFFGLLEILRHLNTTEKDAILPNVQYRVVDGHLSNSLQSKFYFGENRREYSSSELLYVILAKNWAKNVLSSLLKDSPVPIEDVASIAMQNIGFPDDFTSREVIEQFLSDYRLEQNYSELFSITHQDISFINNSPDRMNVFSNLKSRLKISDVGIYTLGFTGSLIEANAGEIARGPFVQPLYAGQENVKYLLLSSFDLLEHYNIVPPTGQATPKPVGQSALGKISFNKIIYGAPGTGKSYELRRQSEAAGFLQTNVLRVTLHPNYSYHNFVGTYKPVPIYRSLSEDPGVLYGSDKSTQLQGKDKIEPMIDYTFVPGPFLSILINSLLYPANKYLLIIEEINRAPIYSVFGDIFQLLDRTDEGISEYGIEFKAEVADYLKSCGIEKTPIKIPSNLFIWATMNSADQGVMPLDSAFKRRWEFEYLPLDKMASVVDSYLIVFANRRYNWNRFRKILNDKLKELGVPEDKLIGPFFLSKAELENPDSIKNKLLLYLRDDIMRHNPENLFVKRTFSDIVADYDNGQDIFIGINFDAE